MKKILGLATGLLLTVFTFAHHGVTFNDAGDNYNKAEVATFNFSMGDDFTAEQINKAASYYTNYFTTSTAPNAEGGHNVSFTLVEDTDMSRKVIMRFFVSLEVSEIDVNGTHLELNTFMADYISK